MGQQAFHRYLGVRCPKGEGLGVAAVDADGGGAEGECFDGVGAGADAGVEQHLDVAGGLDDIGEGVDGGDAAVGLPAAAVEAVDTVDAEIDDLAGVVGVTDALDDDRQGGRRTDPVQDRPSSRSSPHPRASSHCPHLRLSECVVFTPYFLG